MLKYCVYKYIELHVAFNASYFDYIEFLLF